MSQSLLYHAFGVREGYEYQKTEYVEGRVEFHLRAKEELLKCPDCGHEPARRRGRRWRRLRTVPIGMKEVVLVTEVPRCQCQQCGKTFDVTPLLPSPMPATPTVSRSSSAR
jgi:transposase